MAAVKGTRTPDGAPPARGGPPVVRYDTSPVWPGITTGHDARCQCTWAPKDGEMQVKFRNSMCVVPEHQAVNHGQH